ncbi:MAG: hypothetical protein UHJ41_06325 [Bacteroidaceae bacterium]|nr:hypothetical protein [Bacteroidaceae bacterium]
MLKLLLLTLGICAISILLLSIRILLQKGGRFRSLHIGQSPEMRKKGIHCVQSMDRMMRHQNPHRVKENATNK